MSTATSIRRPSGTRLQVPGRRIRVAQIVTKFTAGAGGVTLRGALALDQDRYSTTVFAADGGSLTEPAKEAGLEVVVVPQLAGGRGIYPWAFLRQIAREHSEIRKAPVSSGIASSAPVEHA